MLFQLASLRSSPGRKPSTSSGAGIPCAAEAIAVLFPANGTSSPQKSAPHNASADIRSLMICIDFSGWKGKLSDTTNDATFSTLDYGLCHLPTRLLLFASRV